MSIKELLSFLNKPTVNEVHSSLLNKGWKLFKVEEPDANKISLVVWAYEKNPYSDLAKGWFNLFLYQGRPGKLGVNFSNASILNRLKSDLKLINAKFIKSLIEDNSIITTYSFAGYSFILTASIETPDSDYKSRQSSSYYLEIYIKEGQFDNENGIKKYFENGKLTAEANLKDGELDGLTINYYENGTRKSIKNFSKGKKEGPVKEFDEKGNLDFEGFYKNDLLDGRANIYYYDSNNRMSAIEKGAFAFGKRTGLWEVELIKKNNERKILAYTNYTNGLKHGSFRQIKGDSIIYGNFNYENLSGKYLVYLPLSRILFGSAMDGDTSNAELIAEGYYKDNLRTGYWKQYSITTTLIAEGRYEEDVKTGVWNYYYDNYFKTNTRENEAFSKQLYLKETYLNGKLNGKRIRYSFLEQIDAPCDTTQKELNKFDSCKTLQFEKVTLTETYRNDKLNGTFELIDSSGLLIKKGMYVNDEKTGEWIEGFSNDGLINYKNMYLYQKGNYSNGKKVGKWIEYITDSIVFYEIPYSNNKIDGIINQFGDNKAIIAYYRMNNGNLTSAVYLDSLGKNILRNYYVINQSEYIFQFRRTEYTNNNSRTETDYFIYNKEKRWFDFRHLEFWLKLETKTNDLNNSEYRDGDYKEFKNDIPIVQGQYKKGKKNGEWLYYNEKGKLMKKEIYMNGELQK